MGLTKDTFKHASIYSLGALLGRMVSFIMLPFYAYIFQTEGYGIIGIIDASLGFLSILFATGFHAAITRIYHEEEGENKKAVISSGMWLVWGLSFVVVIFPAVGSRFISDILLGDEKYYFLVCLALITLMIDVAGQSMGTYLIVRQRSFQYTSIGLLRLIVGLSLNIWLVIILRVGLIGIFVTSFINALLGAIIFHWIAINANGIKFDRKICRKLFAFQMPLLPGELIAYASRQAERFLVRFQMNLEFVGILEMAYKFPPLLNLVISFPFMRSWRTKSIEIGDKGGAPELIGTMLTKYIFIMGFGALLMAVSIKYVLEILTPPEFWQAYRIARIEIVTTVLAGATSYMVFGLLYMKETRVIALIKSVCAIIKIGLSVLFIKLWGLKGAAWSALVVECIILYLTVQKSQKAYPIRIEFGKIAVMVLACFVIDFGITLIDYSSFPPAAYLKTHMMDNIKLLLASTFLESWKDGKLVNLLQEREDVIISLIINLLFSLSYLVLFPIIQPELVKRALGRLRNVQPMKVNNGERGAGKEFKKVK